MPGLEYFITSKYTGHARFQPGSSLSLQICCWSLFFFNDLLITAALQNLLKFSPGFQFVVNDGSEMY